MGSSSSLIFLFWPVVAFVSCGSPEGCCVTDEVGEEVRTKKALILRRLVQSSLEGAMHSGESFCTLLTTVLTAVLHSTEEKYR